ncbi:MAG: DMT family transporter [Mogibacterium sp.]|nr:DMT family transporter [Mogibacterium sp.]
MGSSQGNPQHRGRGNLLAMLCIILWSTGNAVSALLLIGRISSTVIVFYMSLFSSVVLFLVCLVTGRLSGLRTIRKEEIPRIVILGLTGFFVYYHALFFGMERLKVQQASTINYLWPMLIVLFAAWIYKEPLTKRKVFALLVSFFGVVYIAAEGDLANLAGINFPGLLGSGGAACLYALFSVLNMSMRLDKLLAMMLYSLSSFAASALAVAFRGGLIRPSLGEAVGLAWMGALLAGVVYALWITALTEGDTAVVSNLAYLNPCFSLVFIWLLLREPIEGYSYIGLGLVLAGIAIQLLPGDRERMVQNDL